MRLFALAAAVLLGCGVKAPPRPPLREAADGNAPTANPNAAANPNANPNANPTSNPDRELPRSP